LTRELNDASAFRRVQSNEQDLKISDMEQTQFWFRQHTRELKVETEDHMNLENPPKVEEQFGRLTSRAFSGFQYFPCRPGLTQTAE
jgi:beta-lactamase class D